LLLLKVHYVGDFSIAKPMGDPRARLKEIQHGGNDVRPSKEREQKKNGSGKQHFLQLSICLKHEIQAKSALRTCTSIGRPPTKKSTIAVLRQPLRARKMALPRAACSGWIANGIDAENQKRCFIPLGPVAFGIEETTIRYEMFFVIVSQRICTGRLPGEHGAKVSFAHLPSSSRLRAATSLVSAVAR
jgi:hypothetical protein